MAGLSHIRDVFDKRGKDFLDGILNKTVIVNEKMDGAFFGAQMNKETGKFRFFKRNTEMSYVDRVLSRYYEPAIRHFEGLNPAVVAKIPAEYHFGMEWFTSPKAQSIAYDRLPKNGLILSYIHVMDETGKVLETIQDQDTLNYWADLLNIERPPIVFQGKLNNEQKEKIQEFVYTPFEELVDRFKTTSFTKYIISILNPSLATSFLRDSLDKDIEGLVFRFYDPADASDDSVFLAKLVDPVFQANAKQKAQDRVQKKSDDYIWIIVIDLMNFIERYSVSELREIELVGNSYEEKYISLVNHIFLEFIQEFGEKYQELDIQIPDFLQRADFNVNYDLVQNTELIKIIEANPNFKEIYRVFLNIFRKKKVRVSSTFFNKEMKANLNSQIEKLSNVIMGDSVYENYFPTFNEFVGDDREPGYFETFAEVPEEKRKSKRVNLIISDFQPIHAGHIKSAQKLFDQNGLPCLLVCIHTDETSKIRPFKKSTVTSGLSKIAAQHTSVIIGYVTIPDGEVETILKAIKPDYEPVIISSSKSRIKDIALQLELARKRSRNLNLRKDLQLVELPTAGIKDSIMKSVKDQDYTAFKSAAPSAIHSEFFNMNKDLTEKLNEAVEATYANEIPEISADEIEELIDKLRAVKEASPEKFEKILAKINSTIKTSNLSDTFAAIAEEIVNRGYFDFDAERFIELIESESDVAIAELYEYIKDGGGLDIETLAETGELTASDFGKISDSIVTGILTLQISNKSGTGQGKGIGELSAMLLKDGTKKKGIGDIQAGDTKIEVKGNMGRLLSSTSKEGIGFANGTSIITTKIEELKKITASTEVSDFCDTVYAEDNGSPLGFSISQKHLVKTWKPLFQVCIDSGLTAEEFVDWFISIFSGGIWTRGCDHESELKVSLLDFFTKNGPIQDCIDVLAYHSLLYYAKVDEFSILFVINKNGDTASIIYYKVESGYENFKKHLFSKIGPQWKDSQNHNIFNIIVK